MGLGWLIVLIGIGALAYFAIKGRIIRLREEFQDALRKAQTRRSSLPSEDMQKCPTCGTYYAPSTKSCGNPNCEESRKASA